MRSQFLVKEFLECAAEQALDIPAYVASTHTPAALHESEVFLDENL